MSATSSSSAAAPVEARSPPPRPLGQEHSPPRARELAPTRAGELARAERLRREPYVSPDTWYDAKEAVPAPDPLLRRRRDQALRCRSLSAPPGGLRRAPRTTTASRRPGRSPTTSSSPTTRRRSSSTRCTARAAKSTEPRRAHRYPYPAVSHEPRIQQLSDDLAAAGYRPFHAPCGILLDETNPPYSTCVRCANCDGFPCPLHAKSDAEVIGVRPALEYPNVTLLTNAKAVGWGRTPRAPPSPRSSSSTTGRRNVHRRAHRRLVRRRQLGEAAPRIGERQAQAGLANGSDQVGRNFMFHDSRAVLALA